MSKSDGNVKLLNEYIDEYGGDVVRFFFLRAHYRSPQEFSEQLLEETKKTLSNLAEFTKDVVAKPNDNELSEVKHHFIGQKSIENLYSAGEFEVDVINFLKHYFKSNDLIIMTGGSGMYIDAVCSGLDEIPRDEKVREELNTRYEKYGL